MRAKLAWKLPATHVIRPERREFRLSTLDKTVGVLTKSMTGYLRARMIRILSIVPRVGHYSSGLKNMPDDKLKDLAGSLRAQLQKQGFRNELVAHTFALVREVATRTVGMRHFDVQLMGGLVLLKGMVAEMETGEGKTLTATLAVSTAAMAGIPVHVISVNDYLTSRDAEWMEPIYKMLGLKVGSITHDTTPEERRAAYQSDVTYCTNKEIAFDYLRDRLTMKDRVNPLRLQAEYLYGNEARGHRLLLRGLHFAIVDEADSIMVDEARTPLIISKRVGSGEERVIMEQALALAEKLQNQVDYRVDWGSRKVELTKVGKSRIRDLALSLGPLWTGTIRREELANQALNAIHLFLRDEHYLVRDGKVQIIDEFTGRVMPDRSWKRGLHQLVETKEGCEMTQEQETMARISYQRFFRRYLRLSGMTGTAREVEGEMNRVYGLPVVRIPTNRPKKRSCYPDRILPTAKAKWQAVVDRIHELSQKGRPVLVGTGSVSASEHVSRLLSDIGLEYQILNAKQDKEEAMIIARAGNEGCITIATNMAGRGTDIKLGSHVAERQGLHVILTERHEAGRIDRQLAGRCGRQGDPGSYEAILSLEDSLFAGGHAGLLGWIAKRLMQIGFEKWDWVAKFAILRAQKKIERIHAGMRRELLKQDEKTGDMLSFSGIFE